MNPNAWHFSRLGEPGPIPNPTGHTFPLMTHDTNGTWRLVGTGFYINDQGFFVTAKHVIEDVLEDGVPKLPLGILHLHSPSGLFGPTEAIMRPVSQCWLGDKADIALGVAASITNKETGKPLTNWTWTLSWPVPTNGSVVATYAFPDHAVTDNGTRFRFSPDAYAGRVEESGEFRDQKIIPFPFLQVNCRMHGGASGGPIICNGYVVGINCTEYAGSGPAYGTQSSCLAAAFLDGVALPGEVMPRQVTFDELVRTGCINVQSYQLRGGQEQSGTILKFERFTTAPLPAIEIAQQV